MRYQRFLFSRGLRGRGEAIAKRELCSTPGSLTLLPRPSNFPQPSNNQVGHGIGDLVGARWASRLLLLGGTVCSCAVPLQAQSLDQQSTHGLENHGQAMQRPVARNYGGWQAGGNQAISRISSDGRSAYFQSSGMPMPPTALPNSSISPPASLPTMPGASYDPPSLGAVVQPAGQPFLPSAVQPAGGLPAYEPFNNPGGMLPPTEVRPASDTQLRDPQVAHQGNVLPPINGNNRGALTQPVQYQPNPYQSNQYQPTQYQPGNPGMAMPGVYPPAGYAQPGTSQQVLPPQSAGQVYAQPNDPRYAAQQMRDASIATASRQVTNSGIPVVSQDPRFISPPPRTGNYATLPYVGPYRTVAYQLPQATAPQVQAAANIPTQPANVASTTTLPQYQPTVGVQPIAYQSGYQAGYQYCAPGIPAGGVPQVVPGAVAPPTYPPNLAPQLYSPNNSGYKPLFSLGQENYNVQLGRGIIGQPTAYVPGQYVRNFLRYISP